MVFKLYTTHSKYGFGSFQEKSPSLVQIIFLKRLLVPRANSCYLPLSEGKQVMQQISPKVWFNSKDRWSSYHNNTLSDSNFLLILSNQHYLIILSFDQRRASTLNRTMAASSASIPINCSLIIEIFHAIYFDKVAQWSNEQ